MRRCSYTFVPATSFKSASRSWSFAFVRAVICVEACEWGGSRKGGMFMEGEDTHSSLRDDVVRVALAEASALQKVHDISLACALLVETVFILLETDGTPENDLVSTGREPVV